MVWIALQSEMNQLASDYYSAEVGEVEAEEVTLVNGHYNLQYDDGARRSTLWSLQFEYDESGRLTHIRHTDRDILYECEGGVCITEPTPTASCGRSSRPATT